MERNLDRRVKVLTPIRDASLRHRLDKILEIFLADAMSDSELRMPRTTSSRTRA